MIYITVKQNPAYHQLTLEEFLSGDINCSLVRDNKTNTRTYTCERLPVKIQAGLDVGLLIAKLQQFNMKNSELRSADRESLYRTFHIPKKSGGLRRIDAPNAKLMEALKELKKLFEEEFFASYHTSAFAYVKGRSTIDAVKRHQMNNSHWFGKYDLSNFFGSTTPEFVINQLSSIYPFSEVIAVPDGREALSEALDLAFLNGGLPQGTPISPLLTNIIMIPIDFKLSNSMRNFGNKHLVYTRYADDFLISSVESFNPNEVEKLIVDVLAEFSAPFTIKHEKTRYGSNAGRNWNLGVMLNKDNEITVGAKRKREFKAMLSNFIMDTKNGTMWSQNDVQVLEGYRSYYRMVERETIDELVKNISNKYGVDVVEMIKEQLRM